MRVKKVKKAMNVIYGRKSPGTGFKDIHNQPVRSGDKIKHIMYSGLYKDDSETQMTVYSRVEYSPAHAAFGVFIGKYHAFMPLYVLSRVEVIK